MDCIICRKHEESQPPVFENDNWIISEGAYDSQLEGYLVLEPKRHVENWTDFRADELSEMGPLISKIENSLKSLIDLERLYVLTISEQVRHIHFHLIPRVKSSQKKGITLIEQATQQKDALNQFTEEEYSQFISKVRSCI